MKNSLLTDYVKSLHLRSDAPMPSEIRDSHERIKAFRSDVADGRRGNILPFVRRTFRAAPYPKSA